MPTGRCSLVFTGTTPFPLSVVRFWFLLGVKCKINVEHNECQRKEIWRTLVQISHQTLGLSVFRQKCVLSDKTFWMNRILWCVALSSLFSFPTLTDYFFALASSDNNMYIILCRWHSFANGKCFLYPSPASILSPASHSQWACQTNECVGRRLSASLSTTHNSILTMNKTNNQFIWFGTISHVACGVNKMLSTPSNYLLPTLPPPLHSLWAVPCCLRDVTSNARYNMW